MVKQRKHKNGGQEKKSSTKEEGEEGEEPHIFHFQGQFQQLKIIKDQLQLDQPVQVMTVK
jgi:uncharacterized metal-binding protein YceD (DUF177 family)